MNKDKLTFKDVEELNDLGEYKELTKSATILQGSDDLTIEDYVLNVDTSDSYKFLLNHDFKYQEKPLVKELKRDIYLDLKEAISNEYRIPQKLAQLITAYAISDTYLDDVELKNTTQLIKKAKDYATLTNAVIKATK